MPSPPATRNTSNKSLYDQSHNSINQHTSRHKTHPLVQYASIVLPSLVPNLNPARSDSLPNAASNNPASLTLATRLGTAARVVASSTTPRRLVCFAKFTASRTERQRLSGSVPGRAGIKVCLSSAWLGSTPHQDAKRTASDISDSQPETYNLVASS